MMADGMRLVDATRLSLQQWLVALEQAELDNTLLINDYCFPTDRMRDSYLRSIHKREEPSIRWLLLKFLIPNTSFPVVDKNCRDHLDRLLTLQTPESREAAEKLLGHGHFRRLLFAGETGDSWEGVTWILDLLPHRACEAIGVLTSYLHAHLQFMPDGRVTGLQDSRDIIRARYLASGHMSSQRIYSLLDSLSFRELEVLTARLFSAMGYRVALTPARRDGGRDVIATRIETGYRTRTLIECKAYRDVIGVEHVRQLYGVVSHEKANKGILVTTSQFTQGARRFAAQNHMELISRSALAGLLNKHLGATWPDRLPSYASEPRTRP